MTEQSIDFSSATPDSFADALVALLVKAGAPRRSADIFIELRGLAGRPPRSLRSITRGLSAERIRQLVGELEAGALQALHASGSPGLAHLRADIAAVLRRIEQHAPGSEDDIRAALAADIEPLDMSPASVLRLADILAVHHGLRLTSWTARAKFSDEERRILASPDSGARNVNVCAIVPDTMPEVFENFINFARKFSRGAGVVAAGQMAARYGNDRGVALAPHEAAAFLKPFAVHLGRHDGDEWFAFFNSANDFVRKAATRVELFGQCSFETIRQFHERYNRSLYASQESSIPQSVLGAVLELAGFHIENDDVRAMGRIAHRKGRGLGEIRTLMVKVFKETLAKQPPGRKSVRRGVLLQAMLKAGICESTACVYLGNQGLFVCSEGLCRLADTQGDAADGVADAAPAVKTGRKRARAGLAAAGAA